MQITLEPYRLDHGLEVLGPLGESCRTILAKYAEAGPAFTGRIADGRILACAGLMVQVPWVADGWMLPTPLVARYPLAFHKTVKDALEKITNITMNLLSHSVAHIKTPTSTVEDREFILEFLRNCDKKMYTAIRDHSGKLREQAEIKPMDVKCANCEHEYKQAITLNPTDFFD
jgi:hypothetical protein